MLIVFSSEEESTKFSREACWITDKPNYLPTLCPYLNSANEANLRQFMSKMYGTGMQ